MPKAEKSWSGMRRYLEREMLAPSLAGRVRYDCAAYPGAQSAIRFEIFVDGKMTDQFSMETMAKASHGAEKADSLQAFWADYWAVKQNVPVYAREVYDDMEFADALKMYRQLPIGEALASENPIVRLFAILDRRTGKRRLEALAKKINIQPQWLQFYIRLRLSAEGMGNGTGRRTNDEDAR